MNVYRTIFIIVFVAIFCSFYGLSTVKEAKAETQYVSDVLIISVKEGQDPDAPTLGFLRSATPLEVLEETEELMRIQTEKGLQGWVRKKFIVADKPKAVIVKELEEKISLLESDIKTLQDGSDSQDLETKISGFKQEIASLTDTLKKESMLRLALQKELKQINAKYQQLSNKSKDNAGTSKELASLKKENKVLKDKIASQPAMDSQSMLSGNMKWFLIGGGVLLLGFFIGRSIKGKRSYRY
jgi:SH3 domain protein